MNKKFLLIAVMVLASISGFAQTRFAVYAGGAFPMGAFKDGKLNDSDYPEKFVLFNQDAGNKGYAGIGFNVGMDVNIPITDFGLGLTIGADYFYNGYNAELKDYYKDLVDNIEEHIDESDIDSYKLYKGKFMNVPVLVGVNYFLELNDSFGLFAEAAVGPNFRFITKDGVKYEYTEPQEYYDNNGNLKSYSEAQSYTKFDMAITFGYKVGVGVMINDMFSIGLDYYSLGSTKVKGENKLLYDGDEQKLPNDMKNFKGKKAIACSEFAIRVGFHF